MNGLSNKDEKQALKRLVAASELQLVLCQQQQQHQQSAPTSSSGLNEAIFNLSKFIRDQTQILCVNKSKHQQAARRSKSLRTAVQPVSSPNDITRLASPLSLQVEIRPKSFDCLLDKLLLPPPQRHIHGMSDENDYTVHLFDGTARPPSPVHSCSSDDFGMNTRNESTDDVLIQALECCQTSTSPNNSFFSVNEDDSFDAKKTREENMAIDKHIYLRRLKTSLKSGLASPRGTRAFSNKIGLRKVVLMKHLTCGRVEQCSAVILPSAPNPCHARPNSLLFDTVSVTGSAFK